MRKDLATRYNPPSKEDGEAGITNEAIEVIKNLMPFLNGKTPSGSRKYAYGQ